MTDEVLPYSRSTQQRERDALRAAQSRGTVIPPDDDTLRTRIAAAIDGVRIQRDGDSYAMADAVIRELGLRLDRIPDIAGPDWGTHDRWVTPTVFAPGHLHRGGRR